MNHYSYATQTLEYDFFMDDLSCGIENFKLKIGTSTFKGHHVITVFFDLEKAYDTTWKYGIMKDLHDAGLKGKMPLFIQNFLADRVFRVRLGSEASDLHDQDMGVPQGSILSVTLFVLKINSISKVIGPGD